MFGNKKDHFCKIERFSRAMILTALLSPLAVAQAGVVVITTLLAPEVMAEDLWSQSHQLEAEGKYAEAGAVLEPLLEGSESSDYGVLRYAWLFYQQGNYNDAVRNYRRALSRNSDSLDARLGITLPLMAQLRWSEAERFLNQVLSLDPWSYTAHVRLMAVQEGLRQWETLLKHSQAFNKRYPSDANGWVYQARAYLWLKNRSAAEIAYRQVLRRSPQHSEANRYLYGGAN